MATWRRLGTRQKCSRLPARGSMEFRGAARIRAAATDVAWSAVTLANEVHYNVLSN